MRFKKDDVLYFKIPYFSEEENVPKFGYTVTECVNCYVLNHPTFGTFRLDFKHVDRCMEIFGVKEKLDIILND